jgi:hypothetical protein
MSLFSDNQEFNRFNRKKKTSSEDRLYNANLSQSDSDISPKMSRDTKASKSASSDKPKAKAKAKSDEYKMPKQTTPDMDTSQGNYGTRNSFEEGEVAPKAAIAVEATRAPVEERVIPRAREETSRFSASNPMGMKKGGAVKSSKASSRGDGCAQRGKTKGRIV